MRKRSEFSSSFRRLFGHAFVITSVGLLAGCMMFAKAPTDLDYSRTRKSDAGLYTAAIHPQGDSIPKGKLHQWTLHITTAAGTPVDSATLTVNGGMPQHGHGLPTRPQVTRMLGNGDHLVEGMKFNMGGWWVVKFGITSTSGRDSVVFNLKL